MAAVGARPGERAVDPARAAQEAELGTALADATESLDPDERSALSLVSAGGLSYADAAAVEGISRSAFASRVFRARRRVMRFLADRGLVEGEHEQG